MTDSPSLPSPFPVLCSWCGRWRAEEDASRAAAGEKVSHTICAQCQADMDEEIEKMPVTHPVK